MEEIYEQGYGLRKETLCREEEAFKKMAETESDRTEKWLSAVFVAGLLEL